MDLVDAEKLKTLRGLVLRMVYDNHRNQKPHLDLLPIAGVLERMQYSISLNDLVTVMQDMKERGYLDFEELKDRWTGRVRITRISIRPAGRDLVERTENDPAVRME